MAVHPSPTEIAELDVERVEDAHRGDVEAFTGLMQAHTPLVERVVRGIVRDSDDAEDVSQEVWIAVSERRTQLREPSLFRAWPIPCRAQPFARLVAYAPPAPHYFL